MHEKRQLMHVYVCNTVIVAQINTCGQILLYCYPLSTVFFGCYFLLILAEPGLAVTELLGPAKPQLKFTLLHEPVLERIHGPGWIF